MSISSHKANQPASRIYRTLRNDTKTHSSHNANMARRGDARGRIDWFLKEWMDTLGVRQADMQRLAGWSKATASQLYTGVQSYSPKVVNEAALALNVKPYELLMRPEDAMAFRRLKGAAIQIAADNPEPQPESTTQIVPLKKIRT
jgi:transcriptional regulator with XRE-family HTH domain